MSDYKKPMSDGEIAFTKFLEEYSASIIADNKEELHEEVLCARKRFSENLKQDVKNYLLQDEVKIIASKALKMQKESWLKKQKRDIVIITIEVALLSFLIGLLVNIVTSQFLDPPTIIGVLLVVSTIGGMIFLLCSYYINDVLDKQCDILLIEETREEDEN